MYVGDRFSVLLRADGIQSCIGKLRSQQLARYRYGVNIDMDFQDFLKHQFVHVAIGEFKPGKFAVAQKLYEEAVLTYSQGFKGAYLLQEPGTDKGISVIFWENAEDIAANQNQAYQEILKKMMPLFANPPEVSVYELVCEIKPPAAEEITN